MTEQLTSVRKDTTMGRRAARTEHESSPFTRVEKKAYGYQPNQVDEFIARARSAYDGNEFMAANDVRDVSFAAVKGGYAPHQVDKVLDRLEDAFRRAERDEFIESHGLEAWNSYLDDSIRELMGRLQRPAGQRFRRPKKSKAISYRVEDVDAVCETLFAHFTDRDTVTAQQLRATTFRAAKGKKGYEEAEVDAFVQAGIELLINLS
ncbi:DivIVA domain-containing protein [Auritidibacter sp. NML130574]|nr:DivIVA domain-containing protein [Auritidibacter sp. NML130574]PXA78978.1 hypothetical protein DCC25_10515 [Auritidibacter sp. NML120636]